MDYEKGNLFFIFIVSSHLDSIAQDTVFHKTNKKYEVTVVKKGYHHLYTVNMKAEPTPYAWVEENIFEYGTIIT